MKSLTVSLTTLAAALALTACSPKDKEDAASASSDSFPLVPQSNRAASFDAVAQDLDLGGDMFYFSDFGTTFKEIGPKINSFVGSMAQQGGASMGMGMMMAAMMPYDKFVDILGISDLTAIGASSYQEGSTYRNKSVIYLPEGPKGIFALIGNEAQDFDTLALAPSDTDVFISQRLQTSEIINIIKQGAEAFQPGQGEAIAKNILSETLPNSEITIREALTKSDTNITAVIRLGEDLELDTPMGTDPVTVPQTQYLLNLKNMAWLATEQILPLDMLVEEGQLERSEKGNLVIYSVVKTAPAGSPMTMLEPTIIVDTEGGDLTVASSQAFWDECFSGKTKLADSPAFKAATKDLPTKGNSMSFVSKKAFNTVLDLIQQVKDSTPEATGVFALYELSFPILGLESVETDSAMVSTVRSDSIFSDGRWPTRSSNSFAGGGSMMMSGGIVAALSAMAIPAFNEVRTTSQEKTIQNNLRQIASGGQLYLLDDGSVTEVSYPQLVEAGYFTEFVPVQGERYEDLTVTEDGGTLSVITADGTLVEYTY